jgi:hypothetical protein
MQQQQLVEVHQRTDHLRGGRDICGTDDSCGWHRHIDRTEHARRVDRTLGWFDCAEHGVV